MMAIRLSSTGTSISHMRDIAVLRSILDRGHVVVSVLTSSSRSVGSSTEYY